MVADLESRLQALTDLAQQAADEIGSIDSDAADAAQKCRELTAPWGFAPEAALDPVVAGDPEVAADELRMASSALLEDRVDAADRGRGGTRDGQVGLRQAIRALAGHRHLPVLPIVDRSLLPALRSATGLDVSWLEIVAAVRPRLAALEAQQLTTPWPAALAGAADLSRSTAPS